MRNTGLHKRIASAACAIALASFASAANAQISDDASSMAAARANLGVVYAARPDLQRFFRDDWTAVPAPATKGIADLEDWARKYGYMEYPGLLDAYAPGVQHVPPLALRPVSNAKQPVLRPGAKFDFSSLTASSVLVVDAASRETLLARNSRSPWPLASITKLMTALVTTDDRVPMTRKVAISKDDEVGGARLSVVPGTSLAVRDLLNVALIGSANNTANALARSTRLSKADFVGRMNAKAASLGLSGTKFTDPTGIEVSNVSTAEDIAALALTAFGQEDIRRATTTAKYTLKIPQGLHTVKNTDDLLTDETNGYYVLGGKTGYLDESKWNLVVKLTDARRTRPTIEIVVLGTDSRAQSFKDAAKAAEWVWDNYDWPAK